MTGRRWWCRVGPSALRGGPGLPGRRPRDRLRGHSRRPGNDPPAQRLRLAIHPCRERYARGRLRLGGVSL